MRPQKKMKMETGVGQGSENDQLETFLYAAWNQRTSTQGWIAQCKDLLEQFAKHDQELLTKYSRMICEILLRQIKFSSFPTPLLVDYLKNGCLEGPLNALDYFSIIFPSDDKCLVSFDKPLQFQSDLALIRTLLLHLLRHKHGVDTSEQLSEMVLRVCILLLDGIQHSFAQQERSEQTSDELQENHQNGVHTHSLAPSKHQALSNENSSTCAALLFTLFTKHSDDLASILKKDSPLRRQLQQRVSEVIQLHQQNIGPHSPWIQLKDTLQLVKEALQSAALTTSPTSSMFGSAFSALRAASSPAPFALSSGFDLSLNAQYRTCLPLAFLVEEECTGQTLTPLKDSIERIQFIQKLYHMTPRHLCFELCKTTLQSLNQLPPHSREWNLRNNYLHVKIPIILAWLQKFHTSAEGTGYSFIELSLADLSNFPSLTSMETLNSLVQVCAARNLVKVDHMNQLLPGIQIVIPEVTSRPIDAILSSKIQNSTDLELITKELQKQTANEALLSMAKCICHSIIYPTFEIQTQLIDLLMKVLAPSASYPEALISDILAEILKNNMIIEIMNMLGEQTAFVTSILHYFDKWGSQVGSALFDNSYLLMATILNQYKFTFFDAVDFFDQLSLSEDFVIWYQFITKSLYIQKDDPKISRLLTSFILQRKSASLTELKSSYPAWKIIRNFPSAVMQVLVVCTRGTVSVSQVSESFLELCNEFRCLAHLLLVCLCNELETGMYPQDGSALPLALVLKLLNVNTLSTQQIINTMGRRLGHVLQPFAGISDPVSIGPLVQQLLSGKADSTPHMIDTNQFIRHVVDSFVKGSAVLNMELPLFHLTRALECVGRQQFANGLIREQLLRPSKEDWAGPTNTSIELTGCLLGRCGIEMIKMLFQQTVPEMLTHLTEYSQGIVLAHILVLATLFAGVPFILQNQKHRHHQTVADIVTQFFHVLQGLQSSFMIIQPGLLGFVKAMEGYMQVVPIFFQTTLSQQQRQ